MLPPEIENILVEWVLEGAEVADPKNTAQIKNGAWLLSSKYGLNVFGQKGPSNGWLTRFFARHPILTKRKPEKLSKAAVCVTESNIRNWFDIIEKWLIENNLSYLLNESDRIYNADETGFEINPCEGSVIVPKGQKHVSVASTTGKEQITVMYTICANGWAVNPFIVYAGKRLNSELKSRIPKNVGFTMTDKGWMVEKAFCNYLLFFDEQLKLKNVQKPELLFMISFF
jgi:hypothetical protein